MTLYSNHLVYLEQRQQTFYSTSYQQIHIFGVLAPFCRCLNRHTPINV